MSHLIETVFLHVTKACNLRCRYCYFSADVATPDQMSRADYTDLWPSVVLLRPRKVVFTGGEPFLRGDLLDLMSDLRRADDEHRVMRCANTNGVLMTKAIAHQMVGVVDEVRVSIDGLGEMHDRHRGTGSFDAAVEALAILQEAGFEPKVLVTVTRDTLAGLPALIDWLASRGLTRVRFNPVRLTGRAASNPALAVSPAELAAVLTTNHVGDSHPLPTSCGAGHFINVMPNGDVFPCHVLTEPAFRVGNVRDGRLEVMAGADGTLDRLRRVNLRELAAGSPELRARLAGSACLGVLSSHPALQRELSVLPVA